MRRIIAALDFSPVAERVVAHHLLGHEEGSVFVALDAEGRDGLLGGADGQQPVLHVLAAAEDHPV